MATAIRGFFKDLKELMLSDFSALTLTIATVLYLGHILSLFSSVPVAIYGLSVLIFAAYDRLSYHHVLQYKEGKPRTAYRIIQHLFLAIIGAVLWTLSPIATIFFVVSWWMGVTDAMYYVLGKEWKFIDYEDMYWLWWMPWTWFNIPKTGRNLAVTAFITAIASVIGIILLG